MMVTERRRPATTANAPDRRDSPLPRRICRWVFIAALFLGALSPLRTASAQAPGQAACVLGDHAGILEPDAMTSARLVCDELRRRGVDVGNPALDPGGLAEIYVVELFPLGESLFVTLSYESPPGNPVDSRQLQIGSIEEMVVAAPRLAQALIEGVPTEETAAVDTLVGEETREYDKMHGEFFWGIGIQGSIFAGSGSVKGGPGFVLRFFYEAVRFSIGGDFRFAVTPDDEEGVNFVVLSIGGRYFFTGSNVGFYAGGGLGWQTFHSVSHDGMAEGTDTGVGAYVNAGLEVLRLHSSRLVIDVRADLPFFTVSEEWTDVAGTGVVGDVASDRWVVPISLGVYYAW